MASTFRCAPKNEYAPLKRLSARFKHHDGRLISAAVISLESLYL
jgi:hypothetical protein